jgi:hypothetical protein
MSETTKVGTVHSGSQLLYVFVETLDGLDLYVDSDEVGDGEDWAEWIAASGTTTVLAALGGGWSYLDKSIRDLDEAQLSELVRSLEKVTGHDHRQADEISAVMRGTP